MSRLLYLLKPVVAEPNNKPVSSGHPAAKYENFALGILTLNYFFVFVFSARELINVTVTTRYKF